jgi:hypothetical protein
MNPSDIHDGDKHRLLAAWLAGELTADDAARLIAAAQTDAPLRCEMAELQSVERLLRQQGVAGAEEVFGGEVLARLQGPPSADEQFTTRVIDRLRETRSLATNRPHSRRRLPWSWAAAAVVLLALGGLWAWQAAWSGPVASVAGLEAVRWPPGQTPRAVGDALPRGVVEIEAGFLRLDLAAGVKAIVEGPARLVLLGPNRAQLQHGKLTAEVPDAAKGFTVESPEGRIVDLGTRFGVAVDDRGDTEVHVLEGLVQASLRGETRPRPVHQSQALRMTPRQVMAVDFDGSRFLTNLPPRRTGPLGYVHWSFDEGRGTVAGDSGRGLGEGSYPARLSSLADAATVPGWTPGRFGSALEFDGRDGFVSTTFRGIAGPQARTVAFWVRVPQDWTAENAYALVSWGTFDTPGAAWQISINPEAKDGPVGRLRVGVREASVIGARDLRDGQWHHVAAVLYDGPQPRNTTHILIYLDGQLEPAYRRSILAIATELQQPDSSPVLLGRNLNPRAPQRVFRGTVDEVYIVNAALSQESIGRLMRDNRLTSE